MNELLIAVQMYTKACDITQKPRPAGGWAVTMSNRDLTKTAAQLKLEDAKRAVDCERATTDLLEVMEAQDRLFRATVPAEKN
jgi:hypothetical protein